MVIVDDASLAILKTLHLELYTQSKTESTPEYTNIIKSTQTGMIIGYHATNM
jgi:hypothetical protein